MLSIVASRLGKSYGQVRALDDVSVSVGRGRILAVLGHNGAGKSTLVDILSTRSRPDSGTAEVCGWDVTRDGRQVRSRIGVATQLTSLDEALTGRQNLLLVARLLGAGTKQARARSEELLAAFDLADVADRQVRTYSGGLRRRTDLAAALLGHPEVVFLDEPSTGLDPVACHQLWGLVKWLAGTGVTVVLTTQYLQEAEQLADEILVLAAGRVVAQGDPAELKRRVGEQVLTLRFPDPERAERAARRLRHAGIPGTLDEQRLLLTVAVGGGQDVVVALRTIDVPESVVTDVRVKEPSLEDVYLNLYRTGKRAS